MHITHNFNNPGVSISNVIERYKSVDNKDGVDLNPAPDRISLEHKTDFGTETIDVILTKGPRRYGKGFKELVKYDTGLKRLSAYEYNGSNISGYQIDKSTSGEVEGASYSDWYRNPEHVPMSLGEMVALMQLAEAEFAQ